MHTAWTIGVLIGAGSLLYVMFHAQIWAQDDPKWFRGYRVTSFAVAAGMVCYSVGNQDWEIPLPALLTLYAGDLVIFNNAVSLAIKVARHAGQEPDAHTLDAS